MSDGLGVLLAAVFGEPASPPGVFTHTFVPEPSDDPWDDLTDDELGMLSAVTPVGWQLDVDEDGWIKMEIRS